MAVLVFSFFLLAVFSTRAALGLKCPSCLHVGYVEGSVQVASMTVFVNASQNSICKTNPTDPSVTMETCPDDTYVCGTLEQKINVFAHLVGEVKLDFYYHACVKAPLLSETFLGCLDTQTEEEMFYMLWDIVPDSVISQQPGNNCYCRRVEGCERYKDNGTATVTKAPCPPRWFKFAGKCYEWWLILVIVLDCVIVLTVSSLLICCLCPRCPLYYRRRYYQEQKDEYQDRRNSASMGSPGYYLGPALVADVPIDRANIAMPGFGAPIVMDDEAAGIQPRHSLALSGTTMGFAQPGFYSGRLNYQDDEDDRQTVSTGRYTWRTTPRRYRTVYDAYSDDY